MFKIYIDLTNNSNNNKTYIFIHVRYCVIIVLFNKTFGIFFECFYCLIRPPLSIIPIFIKFPTYNLYFILKILEILNLNIALTGIVKSMCEFVS